jgi:hypothetical protein
MKTLIALLAVAVALAAAAGPAQALTRTDYEVIVEGDAAYAQSQLRPAVEGQWTRQEEATFKWRTRFPLVSFLGKELGVVSVAPTTTVTAPAATSHESIPKPGGAMASDCSGDLLAAPSGGAWLGGSLTPDLDPNTEDLGVRLLGDVSVILASCSGTLRETDWVNVSGTDKDLGAGPFDAEFDLPHEAIDLDRIIQLLEGKKSGAQCPGYEVGFTTSCTLTWKATVTFIRTARSELGPGAGGLDESLFVPLPGPVAGEDLVLPLPTPGKGEDLIMPGPKGKLDADARQAKLTVSCSIGCAGTASAYLPGRRTGAAATRPLARARFTGKPGHAATVTLRFPARVRGQIKRAGGVRIAIEAVGLSGGEEIRRTFTLELPHAHQAPGL